MWLSGPRVCRWAGRRPDGRSGLGAQIVAGDVAKLLGLSAEEIQAKRMAGQSLAPIAQEMGVSEAKLVETMLAARKAALDERVKAGSITQTQADAAYERAQAQTQSGLERSAVGPNRPADALRLGLGWGRQGGQSGAENGLRDDSGAGLGPRWAR